MKYIVLFLFIVCSYIGYSNFILTKTLNDEINRNKHVKEQMDLIKKEMVLNNNTVKDENKFVEINKNFTLLSESLKKTEDFILNKIIVIEDDLSKQKELNTALEFNQNKSDITIPEIIEESVINCYERIDVLHCIKDLKEDSNKCTNYTGNCSSYNLHTFCASKYCFY